VQGGVDGGRWLVNEAIDWVPSNVSAGVSE